MPKDKPTEDYPDCMVAAEKLSESAPCSRNAAPEVYAANRRTVALCSSGQDNAISGPAPVSRAMFIDATTRLER